MAHSGFLLQSHDPLMTERIQYQHLLLQELSAYQTNLDAVAPLSRLYRLRNELLVRRQEVAMPLINSQYSTLNVVNQLKYLHGLLQASNVLLTNLNAMATVFNFVPNFTGNSSVNLQVDFKNAVIDSYIQGLDLAYTLLASSSFNSINEINCLSNAIAATANLYQTPNDPTRLQALQNAYSQMPKYSVLRPIAGAFLFVLGIATFGFVLTAMMPIGPLILGAFGAGLLMSFGIGLLKPGLADASKKMAVVIEKTNALNLQSSSSFFGGNQHPNMSVQQSVYVNGVQVAANGQGQPGIDPSIVYQQYNR
jgi:hypothetical protein